MINNKKKRYKTKHKKTKILIVDDHPVIRRELAQLINQEYDLIVCSEAGTSEQVLDTIERKHVDVDLAIVNVSLKNTNEQLADKIKWQYPNLPVLMLSISDQAFYHSHKRLAKKCFVNREVTEQLTEAIHYAQSLIKSCIFGFTVLVDIKDSTTGSKTG